MKEKLNSQARILRIVELLSDDVLQGRSNKELAEILGKTHDVISRDLALLREIGWAEVLPNKNWRISPAVWQQANKVAVSFQKEYLRLQSEQARFNGGQ